MYFGPKLTTEGKIKSLTLQLKAGPRSVLEYRYVLKPNEYMLILQSVLKGCPKVVNTAKPLDLEW